MKVFDNSESEQYLAEARARWGESDAFAAYQQKTRHYTGQDWKAAAAGMDRIMGDFAACMGRGAAPDSPEAQGLVKALQDHISAHYYPCTDEILAGLGQMYVADQRFRENIDRHGDGAAAYVRDAVAAYCGK